MTTSIHPTAVIDPKAELGCDVEVGPHSVIEAGVTIGDRTRIGPLVHIQGETTMGADNVVHTAATLGLPPQHTGYDGAPTRLEIGSGNVFREYVSVNRAFEAGEATRIGNDNFLMGTSHVAHDCCLGNNIVMANGALLAGHVIVGDRVFVGGSAGIHQYVRIGRLAMIGGLSRIIKDVPPFMMAEGHPAHLRGLNIVGLRRADFPRPVLKELKRLLHAFSAPGRPLTQALEAIGLDDYGEEAREWVEAYKTSQRGVLPLSQTRRK